MDGPLGFWRRLGFGSRYFGLDDGLFSFDVSLAAFFMFVFVVLFSHKCLYFIRWLRFGVCTMNFYRRRFNLYFLPAVLCLLVSGCALWDREHAFGAVLRIHVESETSSAGSNKTISVLRSQPVQVNISTDPILTESDVIGAALLDMPGGGFAVEVKFEETAGWRLEQITSINPGKHLAIFAQWSAKPTDGRWLAAPLINRRLGGSELTFTPDASRDEAEELVKALNVDAKRNAGLKDKQ